MYKNPLIAYVFLFGLLSNLVSPRFFILGFNWFPSYVISIVIFILWIIPFIAYRGSIGVSKSIVYVTLILISMVISYSYSVLFFRSDFSLFVGEILRYIFFIPYLLFFKNIRISEKQINRAVIFLFSIVCGVTMLQISGVERAVTIYSYDSHIDSALSGFRLVLTGSDPNVGALISSFFIMYFISIFFTKKIFIYLLLSLIAFSLILLTQSRTTIIGVSVVIVAYTFIISKFSLIAKLIITATVMTLFYYTIDFFDLTYLTKGVDTLQTGDNGSINVRLDNIKYVLSNFYRSPVVGWGTSLEAFGKVKNIDSEYFLIVQRYGLFGCILIISIIVTFIKNGFKFKDKTLGLFVLLMTFSMLFNMSTNIVFYGMQSSSIIIFIFFCIGRLKTNNYLYK